MCDERHSEWKSLDQVLSELEAAFPEEELKKNEKNETYIPVESLRAV